MPFISFIIPVYNAEKYLHPCIDSVLHQLNNCELILVNDGSADSSGEICDTYASKHPNIKVFHTENKGPSQARNLGVDKAQGDYIVFLDSDDYINCDFVQNFENSSLSADVIFYPLEKLLINGQRIPMGDGICVENTRNRNPSEVLSNIAACPKFPASPCGKLVRLDFLKKNQIHFAFNLADEGTPGDVDTIGLFDIKDANGNQIFDEDNLGELISSLADRFIAELKKIENDISKTKVLL